MTSAEPFTCGLQYNWYKVVGNRISILLPVISKKNTSSWKKGRTFTYLHERTCGLLLIIWYLCIIMELRKGYRVYLHHFHVKWESIMVSIKTFICIIQDCFLDRYKAVKIYSPLMLCLGTWISNLYSSVFHNNEAGLTLLILQERAQLFLLLSDLWYQYYWI